VKFVLLLSILAAVLTMAPSSPQAQQPRSTPAPSRQDILHVRMLELRNLERQGDRAGAIRLGEQLLQQYPAEPRIENALLNLYRAERRTTKLMALLSQRLDRNPNDIAAMRELCAHLLALRRQEEALAVIQKTIAANPMDELRYRTSAVLMRSHRQTEVAIALYRQGRAAIGKDDLFAAELAQLEESRGNVDAAIAEYILLVLDPDRRSRAQRKIARLMERTDNATAILAQIDEMRLRNPRSVPVQNVAATIFLQSGRYDDAANAIETADRYAEDQGEHLLEFGRAALRTDENDIADLERVRTGVDVLEKLPRLHPHSTLVPEASRLMAEGLVDVARRVDEEKPRRKLLERALASLDASIHQDAFPELQRDALALRAMILFEELGRKPEALETLDDLVHRQLREGESHHLVQVQMGVVLASMDSLEQARQVLQEIANTVVLPMPEDPHSRQQQQRTTPEGIARARALYHLAELDLIAGDYEMALTGFADLAEEAPEDRMANDCLDLALLLNEATFYDGPEPLKVYARYRKALMQREPEKARAALAEIVDKYPESTLHPIAMFELAESYENEHKVDIALQRYQELVETHAEHRLAPRALEAIGDIWLSQLGQPQTAQEQYERILLEYPDDLFLDGVRRKLLAARQATQEEEHATP
jgi:tetratricopeptide (TPR) repeat protein